MSYTYRALGTWLHNARLIGRAARQGRYAAVVGDETYEILVANSFGVRVLPTSPFVMMYDFLGMESTTNGVAENLGAWALNLIWSQEWHVTRRGQNAALFFGEFDDVPGSRFGYLLPQRRRYAQGHIEFVDHPSPCQLLWACWRACSARLVVQGGGTTTLELEVLRTPFLYFPVEDHAEQEMTVAGRLARHGAGVRMRASTTTPASLADGIARRSDQGGCP